MHSPGREPDWRIRGGFATWPMNFSSLRLRAMRSAFIEHSNRMDRVPQQVHDLLRRMLLPSSHSKFLLVQFVSSHLVQSLPGTPPFKLRLLRDYKDSGQNVLPGLRPGTTTELTISSWMASWRLAAFFEMRAFYPSPPELPQQQPRLTPSFLPSVPPQPCEPARSVLRGSGLPSGPSLPRTGWR